MQHTRPVHMDRKLVEDIGGPLAAAESDLFGFEIELEGRKVITHSDEVFKFFTHHQDGSLRANKKGSECIEYVFKKPLDISNTEKALETLFNYLNQPEVEVFESYRTSVHIHLNMLQETNRTVANFVTLAIIFDELFVSQNGESRSGNNFCLRTRDAEGQVIDLIESIQKCGNFFGINNNNRYSSINVASIAKFGTIEFRSLECTTNYDRVVHWIKTLQALKAAARGYADPREIVAKFSRRGPIGFLLSHLGDQAGKYAVVPEAQDMLRRGMRLAQDFAFCSEWKNPEPRATKGRGSMADAKKAALAQGFAVNPLFAQAPYQWPVPQ